MVRIAANGDIIADGKDEGKKTPASRSGARQPQRHVGSIASVRSDTDQERHDGAGGAGGVGGQAGGQAGGEGEGGGGAANPLQGMNEKLVEWGVPTWNIGSVTIQPVVSVMIVVTLLISMSNLNLLVMVGGAGVAYYLYLQYTEQNRLTNAFTPRGGGGRTVGGRGAGRGEGRGDRPSGRRDNPGRPLGRR